MSNDTVMIASGILIENYKEINKLFIDNGLLEIDKQESGDWAALVLQKNAQIFYISFGMRPKNPQRNYHLCD